MKGVDVKKWNTRFALMYAIGVWSMIGSYALTSYFGHEQITSEKPKEKEEDDRYTVVSETAHFKSITIHRKDFVPYSTRIYNFFMGEPGSGDK